MPATLNFPGVYIEEVPSGVRTITGVATSITAFIGRALRGRVDEPVDLFSFADFEREFGGLWRDSALGYAVRAYFLNGGSQAIVVRVHNGAVAARVSVGGLSLTAAAPGAFGNNLQATIDHDVDPDTATRLGVPLAQLFNLTLVDTSPGGRTEVHRNVTLGESPRRLSRVLAAESNLATGPIDTRSALAAVQATVSGARGKFDAAAAANPFVAAAVTAVRTDLTTIRTAVAGVNATVAALPTTASFTGKNKQDLLDALAVVTTNITAADTALGAFLAAVDAAARTALRASTSAAVGAVATAFTAAQTALQPLEPLDDTRTAVGGADGNQIGDNDVLGSEADKRGLFALLKADLFNLLVIPPYSPPDAPLAADLAPSTIAAAAAFCEAHRAFFLVDPPTSWTSIAAARAGLPALGTVSRNAAVYFPRLLQADPLRENRLVEVAPTGAIAGVIARTDAERGVFKAPAGQAATLVAVPQLSVSLTDAENGALNPLGINCLRTLPAAGRVVWGARTLQGNDRLGSEWKYLPVRRLALFIEESLFRGTQFVVFEPNDEPLYAQIRLNVGAFMQGLFRQGAFQGSTPREAYFVKCDRETTTQADVNLGVVNIHVGFAPLKPAEFVVIRIQQIAGAIA